MVRVLDVLLEQQSSDAHVEIVPNILLTVSPNSAESMSLILIYGMIYDALVLHKTGCV